MNNKALWIIVVCLAVGGLLWVNSQRQQEQSSLQPVKMMDMAEKETGGLKTTLQYTKSEATSQMQEAEQQAKSQVENLQSKIQELIAKAKEYLQNGNYEQAIQLAQQILTQFDPNSTEAKSIIDIAKAKIQELAKKKMEEMKNLDTTQAVADIKGKLGSFGQ